MEYQFIEQDTKMGKKITVTSTRTDPNTKWYWQSDDAANNPAWQQREQFLEQHPNIFFHPTMTENTLTVVIEIHDEEVYNQFIASSESVTPGVLAYCDANGISYNAVTEDI